MGLLGSRQRRPVDEGDIKALADVEHRIHSELIRPVKRRIQEEAGKDVDHRLAVVTQGREIENDVDESAFIAGVAGLLKVGTDKLVGLKLTGTERYPDEVVAHFKGSDDEKKAMKRKLSDKVGLAEHVVRAWGSGASPPNYVREILELLQRSRAL